MVRPARRRHHRRVDVLLGTERLVLRFLTGGERGAPVDQVELGYRMRQVEWGQGYATEGSRALLDTAFTELGVRSVWAETMWGNRGSQRVVEKVGTTFAAALPSPPTDVVVVEGSKHGGVRYQVTQEQWEQR